MAAAQHELDAPPWKRVESTLMATARAIRRAYKVRYRAYNLNITQASLLAFLGERGPVTQTELAHALGAGRAATGLVINGLEKRELIERRDNPDDRRAWLIALRPAGEALLAPIQEVDRVLRRELRDGIPKAERQQLARVLLRVQANLDQVFEDEDQ